MQTGAEAITWNLADLYEGLDDAMLGVDLAEADARAEAFRDAYAGRIAGLSPAELVEAVTELEEIQELAGKVSAYAALEFAAQTTDPARGALLQRVEEASAALGTHLVFFELEWLAVPDDAAKRSLAHPALAGYRHHLEAARRYQPHVLSEAEERILKEKAVTGRSAWVRLFTEEAGRIKVRVDAEDTTLDAALSRLHDPDRAVRRDAQEAVTAALEPGLPVRTYILNTLVADKATDDRLRSYPHWLASRNLANEAPEATVRALTEAVSTRYDVLARWYRLKGRVLGLEPLYDYDRYAAFPESGRDVPWAEAQATVLDAYRSFSPALADIANRFFTERWIDAGTRPGKEGGAFAHPATPGTHPYVLLNYTGRLRDVLTLAHELGHGVHQVLASRQGMLNAHTPLTVAETASVFGETVTFERILALETDPARRLSLLAGRLEDSFATIFRQVAMNRFEDAVHTARRHSGELPVEAINEAWLETQAASFQGAVTLTPNYATWWSYIPHFVHTPGYVYAYAYGNLLALAVYRRYEEEGAALVPRYMDMLAAGGSRSPEELGRMVGVDLSEPEFWNSGLDILDKLVDAAENLANSVSQPSP